MRTALIVLAAGFSRRFGGADKLAARVGGVAIVRRLVDAACASKADPVVIVHQLGDDTLVEILRGARVSLVPQPRPELGMAASIATGINALPQDCVGAAILPGDMPMMTGPVIDRLIDEFETRLGQRIVVPVTEEGAQRNPVIWPRSLFGELLELHGDRGGKALLGRHSELVTRVTFPHVVEFADVDTTEDLQAIENQTK